MNSKYDFINRYIYSLLDPRIDKKIAYIGQSIQPEKRYKQHLLRKSENVRKEKWKKELKELGLQPILKIKKEVYATQFIAFETEMKVTILYRDLGYEILSVSKEKLKKLY